MKIKSVFPDGGRIPKKYTCDGDDVNPEVEFSEIPEGCKSIVLMVDDPDSPSKDWIHWIVWNLNPEDSDIPEGGVPDGCSQGVNDFGKYGYRGPCPRSGGTHRYQFKAFALDSELNVPEGSALRDVENAIDDHVIDRAMLTGTYSMDGSRGQ